LNMLIANASPALISALISVLKKLKIAAVFARIVLFVVRGGIVLLAS
jgi:hypothetical protein